MTTLDRARYRTRSTLAGALCVAGLLAAPVTAPTAAAPAVASPDGMQFGARLGPRTGETDRDAVDRVETEAGRQLDVVRDFQVWDAPFPESFHTFLRDSDRTLILSVKARRANGTHVRWSDLAAARPGSTLYADMARWADRVKAFGKPIYFTFNHEPESKASNPNGEAADFIAAWRRFHEVFDERGVTNARWMWIMTDYAFFVGPQARNDAAKWYPGDDYLDAMGADAYNWFTCRTGINTPWWSLEQIIEPFRDFGAAHPQEELWLTEWASTEDPARPGRKAAWIREAQALFKRPDYAQFEGVAYFDFSGPDACQWYIDSSDSSEAAFHAMGTDPFYGGTAAEPPPADIAFVAGATTNANATSHGVRVPTTVRAGDTLLLFYTANVNATTTTPPPGWTAVSGVDPGDFRARLWTRTATAADVGATVTVRSSEITKADLKVVAYRGAGPTPLDVHATAVDTATGTTHRAPSVTPTRVGDTVVVYWGDKSSTNTDHTVAGPLVEVLPTTDGTGGGHITASVADLVVARAGVPTGTFTATGTGPSSRAVMYTLALRH